MMYLKNNWKNNLLLVLGWLILSAPELVYGQSETISLLTSSAPVERQIKGGESHTYQLTLAANEYARVEVTQEQTRLQLSLFSERKELIAAVSNADAPGLKYLDIVAERATTYFIRVATETPRTPSGKYHLQVTAQRAATTQDHERFALHILNWEVVTLYRQQEKSALQQAAAKAHEAASRWLALKEPEQAGRMLHRAGRIYYLLSQHKASLSAYQQAVAAFQEAGAKHAEVVSLMHIVNVALVSGDARQVLTVGIRALLIAQATHDEAGMQLCLYAQAYGYTYTGDWQKAIEMCRQLLPQATVERTDESDRIFRDDVLFLLGYALNGQGKPREALTHLQEALPLARQSIQPVLYGQILVESSVSWQALGEPQKALSRLTQAAELWDRVGFVVGSGAARTYLGNLLVQLGRKAEARKAHAFAVTATVESSYWLTLALIGQARLQHDDGEWQQALQGVEQAQRLIEGLRSGIPVDSPRVSFQAREFEAYELRNDLLMHLHERHPSAGHDAAALHASETSRARALLQLLSEKQLVQSGEANPQLAAQANQLRQRIAALTSEQVRLERGAVTPRRAAVAAELTKLLAELDFVVGQIRQRNPRLAALTLSEPLTLREIQEQVLDRDTLLLEYELGEERSFLFAVTQDALQTYELPARKVIEPLARKSYELLSRSQPPKVFHGIAERQRWLQQTEREYARTAAQLSRMLLSPVKELTHKRRLLIVTEGMLQYVPFAALPESVAGGRWSVVGKKQNQPPVTSHQPLIANHEIINLPSATTLVVLRREQAGRAAAPKTLLVVADPVFSANDERVKTAPLNATKKTVASENDLLRTLGQPDNTGALTLPRLPASRTEAEAILALVPETARRAVLDFDANREAALQSVNRDYRYIHFATHGLLNETRPELSGLVLSQVNRAGEPQNGILTALDAFNLKLSAELVVLSGCQTALGQKVRGEGLVGLTRGFMSAGARRVLASLWQVNDVATAELMQRFYQGMLGKKKLSPAAALREAQLTISHIPRWQSPYYWAAFTLQGDW